MVNNVYLNYIDSYVKNNTPLKFIYPETRYFEILEAIQKHDISMTEAARDIICASYTLVYAALYYHQTKIGRAHV